MVFKLISLLLTIIAIGNAQKSKDFLIYQQGSKTPRNFHANFKPEVHQSIDPAFGVHEQSTKDPSEDFDWNMDDEDDDMKNNPLLGSPHNPKWNSFLMKNHYANLFPQENNKNEAFGSIDFGQEYAMMNGDKGKASKRFFSNPFASISSIKNMQSQYDGIKNTLSEAQGILKTYSSSLDSVCRLKTIAEIVCDSIETKILKNTDLTDDHVSEEAKGILTNFCNVVNFYVDTCEMLQNVQIPELPTIGGLSSIPIELMKFMSPIPLPFL